MKTKLLLIIIGISGLLTKVAIGQQLPQYSQYMMNQYLLNPAVGGTSDQYHINAGYRKQWLGINDGPSTIYLSGHGHVGKEHPRHRGRHKNMNSWHHGIGFLFVSDRTGPTSRNNFLLSYAYDMQVAKKIRMSFGVFGGIQQWSLDAERIKLYDPSTQVAGFTKYLPDASVGIWVYHPSWYIGASAHQLFMNKIDTRTFSINGGPAFSNGANRLTQHYYVTGGVNLPLGNDFRFVPSLLMKTSLFSPGVSVDINAKTRFKEFVWAGVSYRNNDAVVFLLGLLIEKQYELGYSYDYGIGTISRYGSGSHEIFLGYRLSQKAKIISPHEFW